MISFSRGHKPGATRFDFLGFDFFWGKDRAGKAHLKRRTSQKKLRNAIANFAQWCKQNRHVPLRELIPRLNLKLQGYYNYYGVTGNGEGLEEFFDKALCTVLR